MNTRIVALFLLAGALPLTAQDKKPAAPKTPSHSPEQSALNKLKQDKRNQDRLKEAEAAIRKALKNTDAAKREAERLAKERAEPTSGEAKAQLEKLKGSVDDKAVEELKNIVKDSAEQIRNAREQMKKEGEAPAPAGPGPEPEPVAGSFDNIASPDPIPVLKAPVFPAAPVKADRMVKGPSRDPKHPDKDLPDSDPRTRTYVLSGNVTIRRPTMALDADEVDILFKAGETPNSNGEKKPADLPPSADPVNRPKDESSAIERIVARGRVRFMFVDKSGKVQAGRGGYMIYEEKTGWFIIKDWPEAEFRGRLLRGPSKNSVIRLSRLEEADVSGLDLYTMEKELTADDLPKTADKPVPAAGAVVPRPSDAPSPAPR